MIIDAHAHIYDMLSGFGARGEFRPLGKGKGIWATGEVEQFFPEKFGDKGFLAETLLDLMEKNGVGHAVLLQGGNYGFHNDYAAEAAKKYPDKFTAVGTLDPYCMYATKIFDHFIETYHFRALKFEVSQSWGMTGYHPDLKLDHSVFRPIMEAADDLHMTIVIDMGPMSNSSFDVLTIKKLMQHYKNITFVMTHLFFPCEDGQNRVRLEYLHQLDSEQMVFDVSGVLPVYWQESADFMREVRRIVGAERMLWGTDIPGTLNRHTYRQMIETVTQGHVFEAGELELVMAKNAERVYEIQI